MSVLFRPTVRAARSHETPSPTPSLLGKAALVRGIVDVDGELCVQGKVLGRINAVSLIIGEDGLVDGDVVATDAHVRGRFNGRLFALNVTIESSSHVTGRIFHHTITVAKGARIDARMPWRPPSYFDSLSTLPELQT